MLTYVQQNSMYEEPEYSFTLSSNYLEGTDDSVFRHLALARQLLQKECFGSVCIMYFTW